MASSSDTQLEELLNDVGNGKMQLPDFQRDWTWDNDRIRGILASLSQGYPMGALMRLQTGNADVHFKYRPFEGVSSPANEPEFLILDGQQRLTSIYQATHSSDPVKTKTEKGGRLSVYYYFDIAKCLDSSEDREDAILAVPQDRKIKTNFDRDVVLDLSSREKEWEYSMFPINILFDSNAREDWADGYKEYHSNSQDVKTRYKQFRNEVLDVMKGYKLPVITLNKETPREAVCKVFENVNTGGVALTVFELVTATYATYGFDLRKDWEMCRDKITGRDSTLQTDLLNGIDSTTFLTAMTLYTSYLKKASGRGYVSCKKKDVLDLSYHDYTANRDGLLNGFRLARMFIMDYQHVFRMRDLPYMTQLIPLSSICAILGESECSRPRVIEILSRWYWCGILGEMYGGANETRYANDIEDVIAEIRDGNSLNRTVNAAMFSATRLLTLETRQSAAYKGIMALLHKSGCRDFMNGITTSVVNSMDQAPDIHHIFPKAYCLSTFDQSKIPEKYWDCVVNKTPLLGATNRAIGGKAPSVYFKKLLRDVSNISEQELRSRIASHHIDDVALTNDDYGTYFIKRAKALIALIEQAMGKEVPDKDSQQTVEQFGARLI